MSTVGASYQPQPSPEPLLSPCLDTADLLSLFFLPVQSSLFTLLWEEFFISSSVQNAKGGGNNFRVTLVYAVCIHSNEILVISGIWRSHIVSRPWDGSRSSGILSIAVPPTRRRQNGRKKARKLPTISWPLLRTIWTSTAFTMSSCRYRVSMFTYRIMPVRLPLWQSETKPINQSTNQSSLQIFFINFQNNSSLLKFSLFFFFLINFRTSDQVHAGSHDGRRDRPSSTP